MQEDYSYIFRVILGYFDHLKNHLYTEGNNSLVRQKNNSLVRQKNTKEITKKKIKKQGRLGMERINTDYKRDELEKCTLRCANRDVGALMRSIKYKV